MDLSKAEKTAEKEVGRILNSKGEVISVVFNEAKWVEVRPDKSGKEVLKSLYL